MKKEFPGNSEMAINTFLPFCAVYLCKAVFSALTRSGYQIATKVKDALCLQMSNNPTKFNSLHKNRLAQPPHQYADLPEYLLKRKNYMYTKELF